MASALYFTASPAKFGTSFLPIWSAAALLPLFFLARLALYLPK
jgi:hypothetical protein